MRVAVNQTRSYRINKSFINKLFTVISKVMPRFATYEISVAFIDNAEIKKLNYRYRKKNKPTDVLSFAERDSNDKISDRRFLGEIVVAYPYARQQARRNHRTLRQELIILLTHGFLHLAGYDHIKLSDRLRMQRAEKRILDNFPLKK